MSLKPKNPAVPGAPGVPPSGPALPSVSVPQSPTGATIGNGKKRPPDKIQSMRPEPVDIPIAAPMLDLSASLDAAATGDLVIGGGRDGPLVVELMGDGRLRAPRERTREILRERLARAEVLRTGPGWALLRSLGGAFRPSARERAEAEGEIVMAGALGDAGIALIDVIGFLAGGLQTGVLSVSVDDVERSIYMSRGDVVWASSTAPEDQIGEFLLNRGKITREQLSVVTRETPDRIGRTCVERGFIASHDLWAMVQAQLTEIFDKLLGTEVGVWSFSRISEEALSDSQVHLPTQGLLMDAVRKLDEMRLYREVVRSSDAVVRRIEAPAGTRPEQDPRYARIHKEARDASIALLQYLKSTATIRDLMRIAARGEYEVTRLVYHLHQAKLVEVHAAETSGVATRSLSSVTKKQAHDVVAIYSMAIREMFEELSKVGQDAVLHEAARAFLQDDSVEHGELLHGIRILPDGTLDEASMLLALQATPATVQDLSDALGELLFFLLFQATELLGPRRRDDLARRVKMIHGMLSFAEGDGEGGSV